MKEKINKKMDTFGLNKKYIEKTKTEK